MTSSGGPTHRCPSEYGGSLSVGIGPAVRPGDVCSPALMTTIDAVRELALSLPRSYEAIVRGRVKFRVGRIVYVAFSRDETLMGFGFPKEFRQALIDSEPEKFLMPPRADWRYNWVMVRLAAIDDDEMRHLVIDAWAMTVPKSVSAAYRADPS